MFRRFDIGWRDPSGNHGLIAAHDAALAPDEAAPLYQWTDLTRTAFRAHWFLVSLTNQCMALIRVSPIEGGTRGAASYCQALLFDRADIGWGVDLAELIDVFPPVPMRIGQPSSWRINQSVKAPRRQLMGEELADHPSLLAALLGNSLPLKRNELVDAGGLTQAEQIGLALRSYAVVPRKLQLAALNFGTSDAPGFARPYFGFGRAITRDLPGMDLAIFWLSLLGRVAPEILNAIDPSDPASLFRGRAQAIATSTQLDVRQRARMIIADLLAEQRGALEEAKFSGVEQALSELDPEIKGELLLELVQQLEQVEIAGVHPLWFLRLLGDPAAIDSLSRDARAEAFRRFFEALPNELARIVPQLSPEAHRETLEAVKTSLAAGGAASTRPSGFVALIRTVFSTCLLADNKARGEMAALDALRMVRDLTEMKQTSGSDVRTLSDMAKQLAADLVTRPAKFAARLLDIANHLSKRARGGIDPDTLAEVLRCLIAQSYGYSRGLQVQCFKDAVFTVPDVSSSEAELNRVFDMFETVLPVGAREWVPCARLFCLAEFREHRAVAC